MTTIESPEIEKLRAALSAAVKMLFLYEPGDSRAVSPLFVSLSSVQINDDNEACWKIINEFLEKEIEYNPNNFLNARPQLEVRVGKSLDDFPLLPEHADNFLVRKFLEEMKQTPVDQMRMLTKSSLQKWAGLEILDEELNRALEALRSENILKLGCLYVDPVSDEEYDLSKEDLALLMNEGTFVHPETGREIKNFRKDLVYYNYVNTENLEFIAWLSEPAREPTRTF